MPNRIIREGIITSEPVNRLGWAEEVFYRRLLSVVDDFGRFHGNPSLLRAACYPLQIDKVGNQDIAKWLTECVRAGLVRAYTVEGKDYVEVEKFGQQVRAKTSKFPDVSSGCLADATQVSSSSKASAHLVGDGDVVDISAARFDDFYQAYPRKVARGAAEKMWAKLRPSADLIAEILAALDRWKLPSEVKFIPHPATWLNEKRWLDEVHEDRKRMVI